MQAYLLNVLKGNVTDKAVELPVAIILAVGEISSLGFGGLVKEAAEGSRFNHLNSVVLVLKPETAGYFVVSR